MILNQSIHAHIFNFFGQFSKNECNIITRQCSNTYMKYLTCCLNVSSSLSLSEANLWLSRNTSRSASNPCNVKVLVPINCQFLFIYMKTAELCRDVSNSSSQLFKTFPAIAKLQQAKENITDLHQDFSLSPASLLCFPEFIKKPFSSQGLRCHR